MGLKEEFFELYRYLSQDEIRNYRRSGGANISYLDMLYIDMIFLNKGCTPSLIAEKLGIARSAVTVRLNRLVRDGLVIKEKDDSDRRSYTLSLTGEAIGFYEELFEMLDRFEREIKERFTEGEVDVAERMIRCITGR